jgi:hypothetical protein
MTVAHHLIAGLAADKWEAQVTGMVIQFYVRLGNERRPLSTANVSYCVTILLIIIILIICISFDRVVLLLVTFLTSFVHQCNEMLKSCTLSSDNSVSCERRHEFPGSRNQRDHQQRERKNTKQVMKPFIPVQKKKKVSKRESKI